MHRTVLIFGVIALIGIMLVMYKHYHRMRLHNDVEQLKKVIALTFKEADKPIISKNRLIKGLKYHLGLSGNLVGISINLCKSIQKELFINDTS